MRGEGTSESGAQVIDSAGLCEDERETLRDAAARQVMGWSTERLPWAYRGATLVWHDSAGVPVITWYSWQPDMLDAQAMQVADRMVTRGFRFAMGAEEGGAFAEFECDGRRSRVEHRERRLAILMAALEAISKAGPGGATDS